MQEIMGPAATDVKSVKRTTRTGLTLDGKITNSSDNVYFCDRLSRRNDHVHDNFTVTHALSSFWLVEGGSSDLCCFVWCCYCLGGSESTTDEERRAKNKETTFCHVSKSEEKGLCFCRYNVASVLKSMVHSFSKAVNRLERSKRRKSSCASEDRTKILVFLITRYLSLSSSLPCSI